jgi:hypothetical protein
MWNAREFKPTGLRIQNIDDIRCMSYSHDGSRFMLITHESGRGTNDPNELALMRQVLST